MNLHRLNSPLLRSRFERCELGYRGQYCGDDFAPEFPEPVEDEAEVVSDGGHDGVDLVALASLEEVSGQMAIGFAMSDDGLDGGPPPEFLFDLSMNAAPLAGFEDPARLWHIVAPVSLVHIDPVDFAAGQRLGLLNHLLQSVAVIGVSGQRLGVQDELAALAAFVGGGQRDLDAELVGHPRLALADALGLGRVP